MKILKVDKNSIADELSIKAGDELIGFDGHIAEDILDYEYYCSKENFIMTVNCGGEEIDFEIEKYTDEEIGLDFSREIPVKSCKNNCIFCFVAQLPKSETLRKTLKVRDDDYRHSFISGNYVTLTNVSDDEIERIIRLKLSPLYVSVHSTNASMRNKLLGVKSSPNIMVQLNKLKSAGIDVHTQIVYCPGFNDDVEDSVKDLCVVAKSLAIVPVGLTRGHNPVLRAVSKSDAEKIVDIVEKFQPLMLSKTGTRFVFAADEFYIKADRPVPPAENYEDFSQIENGIGLIAAFKSDFDYAISQIDFKNAKDIVIGEVSIATGKSAFKLIKEHADKLTSLFGGKIRVYQVENDFFGETVTVAGLIVGRDILNRLKGEPLGEKLVLPRTMLREFGDVFLDNMTVSELSGKLGVPVQISAADGEGFVKALLNLTEDL